MYQQYQNTESVLMIPNTANINYLWHRYFALKCTNKIQYITVSHHRYAFNRKSSMIHQ